MARRNYFNKNTQSPNSVNMSQLDREININSSYLKKLYPVDPDTRNYNNNYMMHPGGHREPDLYRDDASILNTNRKRSNSLSSLHHHQHYHYPTASDFPYTSQNGTTGVSGNGTSPLVILPSPTSADYLRNRTRESALINVVMKPTRTRTHNDVEISQILYDDMAYRQLRKDAEAHKIAQIKAVNNISAANMPNLVNITTLPIHAQQQRSSGYESPAGVNKTVKMIKQKDAINKRFSNNNSSIYADTRSSQYQNFEQHANR